MLTLLTDLVRQSWIFRICYRGILNSALSATTTISTLRRSSVLSFQRRTLSNGLNAMMVRVSLPIYTFMFLFVPMFVIFAITSRNTCQWETLEQKRWID